MLREYLLHNAVDERYEEFDFLGASEEYKLHWASGVRPHVEVVLFRRGIRWKLIHFVWYRCRPAIKEHFPWLLKWKRSLSSSG